MMNMTMMSIRVLYRCRVDLPSLEAAAAREHTDSASLLVRCIVPLPAADAPVYRSWRRDAAEETAFGAFDRPVRASAD